MKIAIVHYHLQRGGVTRVIENAIAALGDRAEVTVFSGSPVPDAGVDIPRVKVVPGLSYRRAGTASDAAQLGEDLERAAAEAFGGGGPDVWHIHNHSLGKNVCMPAVVSRLAKAGARMLLQIHDFAEDGRPENFLRQREAGNGEGKSWYPSARHLHYAVLNSRDAGFLGRSGLDPSRLKLLANPVSAPPSESEPESRPFGEGKRFLLYPTRGIRRKNIGELLWLAALAGESCTFATTLAPENPEWQPIHQRWASVAARHRLPVRLGIGEDSRYRFGQLIGWSDALITTSVAEGFGLAFLEPWLAGKAVVGRDLPEITSDFSGRGLRMETLYHALPVPLGWIDAEAFRRRLDDALAASFRQYGRSLPAEAADLAWDAAVTDGNVDFGRLDEALQEQAIEWALRKRHLAEEIDGCLAPASPERIEQNAQTVRENYSLESYGDRLFSLYRDLAATDPGEVSHLDGEAVLDAFLDPARFCLLRS